MEAAKLLISTLISLLVTVLGNISDTVLLTPFIFFVIINIIALFKMMVNS